jgi:hypothetical protein
MKQAVETKRNHIEGLGLGAGIDDRWMDDRMEQPGHGLLIVVTDLGPSELTEGVLP